MRPALFLDRDGVINIDHAYVHKIEDFEFIDGIFDLCRAAVERGYLLLVITNQSGIARGFFTETDFQILTQWMCERFVDHNAPITEVFYCPYHPTGAVGKYRKDTFDRKPYPGMILKALQKYSVDPSSSLLIGDKQSDIQAGQAAGIRTTVLFDHNGQEANSHSATKCIRSLREAIGLLC